MNSSIIHIIFIATFYALYILYYFRSIYLCDYCITEEHLWKINIYIMDEYVHEYILSQECLPVIIIAKALILISYYY